MNSFDLKGWRILAVDDDTDSLSMFAELLKIEQATVDAAQSPLDALDLLELHDYDLLISDVSMPELDGCEFIGEVRRRHPHRQLLAVAMSGYGRSADQERTAAAGFDLHVFKPASILQLKTALSQHVRRGAARVD